jgi:hypothetical protein
LVRAAFARAGVESPSACLKMDFVFIRETRGWVFIHADPRRNRWPPQFHFGIPEMFSSRFLLTFPLGTR